MFNEIHLLLPQKLISLTKIESLATRNTIYEQEVQILTNTLTNNSQHNQCKILQVDLYKVTMEQVIELFQLCLSFITSNSAI